MAVSEKDRGFEIIVANTAEQLYYKELADQLNELYGQSKPMEPNTREVKGRVCPNWRHAVRKVRERNVPLVRPQIEASIHNG